MTRKAALLLLIVSLATAASPVLSSEHDAQQLGQQFTQQFYDKEIASVWAKMTAQMQAALGGEDALRQFRDQLDGNLGQEVQVVGERVDPVQGFRVYTRTSRFEKHDGLFNVVWTLDSNDMIAGFFVQPQPEAAVSPYVGYDTKAHLQLPFNGEWYVFWGGRTVADNYHVVAADQRFAYDMLVMLDGKSYSGDGSSKEQYYCWDEDVLAPGSGAVVTAISDLPDNEPGVMDASNPPGNHVILDLGNDEFALLAHLQQGSVMVEVGDEVAAGDVLGQCGNSGNTSEPHIHFHLQDKPGFGNGNGKPAFFNNYTSDGTLISRGEPKRGEHIQNAQ